MPAESKVTELSGSVGPPLRGIESWGGEREREGWLGGRGCRQGSQGPGARSCPLTLIQRRAGVGRPCPEQFTAVLPPRGMESSSPVLSSRGSRSGGGYRLSPSPDPHPLWGSAGQLGVQMRMHNRKRRMPSVPPCSPLFHKLHSSTQAEEPQPWGLTPQYLPNSTTFLQT